jgi:hypothetical protein
MNFEQDSRYSYICGSISKKRDCQLEVSRYALIDYTNEEKLTNGSHSILSFELNVYAQTNLSPIIADLRFVKVEPDLWCIMLLNTSRPPFT